MKSLALKVWTGPATAALLLGAPGMASADTHNGSPNGNGAKTEKAGQSTAGADSAKPEKKKSYYVPTRGYRLEPQPDIPPYVRNLGKTYKEFEGIDWLNVGLDSRVRFEYRKNDYRPFLDTTTDPPTSQRRFLPNSPWLVRTRAYLGVQNILDPFRFVLEFQDSRAINSIYQLQGQEVNVTTFISGYGELYFKDALGKDPRGNDRPLTFRAGRQHLELLDRRLIAENEFRNTTNNFDGFRIKAGSKDNDWDVDSFLFRPINRYPYNFDRPDWQNWIYGSVFSIRGWSEYATIQPYYLGRHQIADPLSSSSALKGYRFINAPGLRAYGVLGDFDYDADINKQFGEVGELQTQDKQQIQRNLQHDAIAYAVELGYTFSNYAWKPRFSADYIYGTGNASPFDSVNQNFDIFYGFNQPFSRNDYIAWNNIRAGKVRAEFTPLKDLRIDSTFSAYWLASPAGAWDRANLVAPLGNRGDFIGTEIDFRARYKLSQFINLTASYARFWPGDFPQSFAPPVALQPFVPQSFPGQTGTTNGLTARPTDFFYLEVSANGFGDGKPIAGDPARDFTALVSPETHAKAPPPSWRDVYVGLDGGGAWSSPQSSQVTAPISAAPASAPVAAASVIQDQSNTLAGFIGGLHLGANWRFDNNVIAGVEADLHGVARNTDTKWQTNVVKVGRNEFFNYDLRTTTLNYLGTVRGRLGYLAT
ncbi:MAG: alginate export family protein, partial [Beijerinckiaceae bacterium]